MEMQLIISIPTDFSRFQDHKAHLFSLRISIVQVVKVDLLSCSTVTSKYYIYMLGNCFMIMGDFSFYTFCDILVSEVTGENAHYSIGKYVAFCKQVENDNSAKMN